MTVVKSTQEPYRWRWISNDDYDDDGDDDGSGNEGDNVDFRPAMRYAIGKSSLPHIRPSCAWLSTVLLKTVRNPHAFARRASEKEVTPLMWCYEACAELCSFLE